ncbi:hypothetical protein N2152v2_002377 [Parachlorella kessleri]
MQLVVTGFGPFAGVEDNPSAALARRLAKLGEEPDAPDYLSNLRTYVLRVAAKEVQAWLEEELFADEQDEERSSPLLVWQAVNDTTFRVPDQGGWQPASEPIEHSSSCPLGTRLITRLPIPSLLSTLRRKGYPVKPSFSAGRFVCNCTYFVSLLHCRHRTQLPREGTPGRSAGLASKGRSQPGGTGSGSVAVEAAQQSHQGWLWEGQGRVEPQQAAYAKHAEQAVESGSRATWQLVSPPEAAVLEGGAGDEAAIPAMEPHALAAPGLLLSHKDQRCVSQQQQHERRAGKVQATPGGLEGLDPGGNHQQQERAEQQRRERQRYALFVHVPPFRVVPERVQFQFLLDLLHALARCLAAGEEASPADLAAVEAAEAATRADAAALSGEPATGGVPPLAVERARPTVTTEPEPAAGAVAEGSGLLEEDVVVIESVAGAAALEGTSEVCPVSGGGAVRAQQQQQQHGGSARWPWAQLLSCKMQ